MGSCGSNPTPNLLKTNNMAVNSGSGMLRADTADGGFIGIEPPEVTLINGTLTVSDQPVSFHPSSLRVLQSIKAWLRQLQGADFVVYLYVAGMPVDSMWVYASNRALTQLDPGLLSLFSMGALRPKLYHATVMLMPGVCPRGAFEYSDIGGNVGLILADVLQPDDGHVIVQHLAQHLMCSYSLVGTTPEGWPTFQRVYVPLPHAHAPIALAPSLALASSPG